MTPNKMPHSIPATEPPEGCPFHRGKVKNLNEAIGYKQPNFFSLFNLPPRPFDSRFIIKLSEEMTKPYPTDTHGLSNIPSGYVYLGQFIVHDITRLQGGMDLPSSHQQPVENLSQLANPSLELDSIYGDSIHEDFYNNPNIPLNQGRMVLGHTLDTRDRKRPGTDLPRHAESLEPLIGDPRNDENVITAQLHVLFLKFHNWCYDKFLEMFPTATAEELYKKSREQVILHYQEIVLYDFLGTILDPDVWKHVILGKNGTVWNPSLGEQARIPLEFSGAAMRFGHAMVRPSYSINEGVSLALEDLFKSTGKGGFWNSKAPPRKNEIDWGCFFPDVVCSENAPLNYANRISDRVTLSVPGSVAVTGQHFNKAAARNMIRANQLKLPAGDDIAETLLAEKKFKRLLRKINLTRRYIAQTRKAINAEDGRVAKVLENSIRGFPPTDVKAPLWYYVLVEARCHETADSRRRTKYGLRLGKIGSLIIAETFLGLARMSRISWLRRDDKKHRFPVIERTGSRKVKGRSRPVKYLRMVDIINILNVEEHGCVRLCSSKHDSECGCDAHDEQEIK